MLRFIFCVALEGVKSAGETIPAVRRFGVEKVFF